MKGKTASDESTNQAAGSRVVEHVLKHIEDDRLKPGDRLPAARERADHLEKTREAQAREPGTAQVCPGLEGSDAP
jgi:DNA-binding FadR family transcriptional regulator